MKERARLYREAKEERKRRGEEERRRTVIEGEETEPNREGKQKKTTKEKT
jgi:hypothetical protein